MSIKQYKYPLLIFLTLLLTIIIGPQNALADTGWQTVGSPGFSAGEVSFTSVAINNNGIPYIVYLDKGNSEKATVKKYDGSSWQTVGIPGFSTDRALATSIAIDSNGTPYVVYMDGAYSDKATVMKFNGTSWQNVGSPGFSAGIADCISMALDSSGTPYVAYTDYGNSHKATVMKYNGSSWQTVGSPGFSAGEAWDTSIAIDNIGIPYIVYVDAGNSDKATVMKYNGSSWQAVGIPGFTAGKTWDTSIALDGSGTPYVVYMDYGNSYKATVMKYNGSSWQNVGSPGFSAGTVHDTSIALDSNKTPYVEYQDGCHGPATVMRYNGSDWQAVGSPGFSACEAFFTSIDIDDSGNLYVAYKDCGNLGKATVKKYAGFSTPLLVNSYSPADNASGIARSTNLVLTFNQTVSAVSGKNIYIKKTADNTTVETIPVTDTTRVTVSGAKVTINPTSTLAANTGYYVLISSGAFRNAGGGLYAGITTKTIWNFTTATATPLVSSYSPKDNATGIGVSSNLVLSFNQNVSAVSGKNIYIKKTADNTTVETIPVTDTTRVTVSGAKVTINPTSTLAANTGYYVLISSGAFKGVNGGLYAGITTKTIWNFTTATANPLVSSYSPADNATGVARTSNLVLTFNQTVSAVSGKNIYIKKTADNTIVETIPVTDFTRVTVSSNKVTINPTTTLTANTGYYVLISSGAFKGVNGGLFAGITTKTIWNFTTSAT